MSAVDANYDRLPLQMPAAQISLAGVRKYFGTSAFVALDGITIDSPQGEFFVIVGPSGCGKTTLLRILAGLAQQSEGTVDVRQADPSRPTNSLIFQGDSLFPWMTIYDNAAYGLRMRKVAEQRIADIVRLWLGRIGLWRFRDRYPNQLSGGMRQRVGALPSIMAGIKLAAGMGLILIAISGMAAANDGIGSMIWNAWQVLTADTMYVGLLVIAILGFVFSVVLDEIERWLIPWKSGA